MFVDEYIYIYTETSPRMPLTIQSLSELSQRWSWNMRWMGGGMGKNLNNIVQET
jgi:hypothetical protein